jgi:hypothetical protein
VVLAPVLGSRQEFGGKGCAGKPAVRVGPRLADVGGLWRVVLRVPPRVVRLDDMRHRPQCGGAEGVIAMRRAEVIAALLGLLEAC